MIDVLVHNVHRDRMLSKASLLATVEQLAKSRAEIARVLNLAPARITEMYSGGRDLSYDEACRLAAHYGIENEGGGELEQISQEHGISFIEEVDLALGMGGGAFAELAQTTGLVPFKDDWLRDIHAGSPEHLRVVRGRGDSMQPTILDGDIVLVDLSKNSVLDQDRIWAVFWGELGMIKRVRRLPGGSYSLMSDNPAISPIEAVDGEMHVLGRVIWIGRKV